MTTPANWYPDPEYPGQLRYWDGASWTEHRAPDPTPAAETPAEAPVGDVPSGTDDPAGEQATAVVSLPDGPTAVVPTRSAADPTPAPDPEPSSGGAHRAPEPTSVDPPTQQYEAAPPTAPSYQQYEAAPPTAPSYAGQGGVFPAAPPPGAPPSGQPSYGGVPSGPPPSSPPPGYGPPAGPPPSGGKSNKGLIIGLVGGAAALLLVIALALVYVFVIRDDDSTVTASETTSSSKTRTSSSEASTSESTPEPTSEPTETQPPIASGEQGIDGDFGFTIVTIEAAVTITSTFSDMVSKTAAGTYAIVTLDVLNLGIEPVTFLATFQRLNGSGQSLAPDDEATVFAGGGYADIAPGEQVQTVVVFDVPDDVEPETLFLQGSPISPGVEVPF